MEYSMEIINISREELINSLKQRLNKQRFEHVLRVEDTAIKLAEKNNVDPQLASIAALLHDYAKDMNKDEMLQLATKYWPEGQLESTNSAIWHGFAAAEIAKTELNVTDISILNAVSSHTIGWYEMDDLAKVLFVADYIEPGRDFKGVDEARKLAEKNINLAVIYKMAESIQHLVKKRQVVYPHSIIIYNQWVQTFKEEL